MLSSFVALSPRQHPQCAFIPQKERLSHITRNVWRLSVEHQYSMWLVFLTKDYLWSGFGNEGVCPVLKLSDSLCAKVPFHLHSPPTDCVQFWRWSDGCDVSFRQTWSRSGMLRGIEWNEARVAVILPKPQVLIDLKLQEKLVAVLSEESPSSHLSLLIICNVVKLRSNFISQVGETQESGRAWDPAENAKKSPIRKRFVSTVEPFQEDPNSVRTGIG